MKSPAAVTQISAAAAESGPLVPAGTPVTGFGTGQTQTLLLNRRTEPCVTLIFPRSIVPPSASTGFSRCSIRSAQPDSGQTYPPYNIERTGEDAYRISMAVAGFSESEISIEAHRNVLTVKGERKEENDGEGAEVLYRGIAARAFERRFQLADHVEVDGATLKNGLLHIDLKRNIPEELKPRKIDDHGRPAQAAKQIEAKAPPKSRLSISS